MASAHCIFTFNCKVQSITLEQKISMRHIKCGLHRFLNSPLYMNVQRWKTWSYISLLFLTSAVGETRSDGCH